MIIIVLFSLFNYIFFPVLGGDFCEAMNLNLDNAIFVIERFWT